MRSVLLLSLAGLGALAPVSTGAQQASVADQQRQLQRAQSASRLASERAARLERQSAAAKDEVERIAGQRAAIAARAQAAEADIAAAHARIRLIDRELQMQRARLAARRAPTARLVAALQSLARRPASLALLQPGSTRDAVHIRALLSTVVPVVRARSRSVRADMERARALRDDARSAAAGLRDGRERLEKARLNLVRAEAAGRLRSRNLSRGALVESDRAIALGEEARDIVDRIATAETAAATRKRLMALSGPLPRPDEATDAAPGSGASYRLPVAGTVVTGFGEVSESGVRSRGLTLASASGATVVAPAAGRVLFARPFGAYGTVIILDHGDDWSSLLSGLEMASVKRGDRVAQGAPLGRAGRGSDPRITVELRRRGEPFDLVGML